MLRALLLASVISLLAFVDASAQSTVASATEFRNLDPGAAVSVFDRARSETRGVLVAFTPNSLTIAEHGTRIVFDRKNVVAVFERGKWRKHLLYADPAAYVRGDSNRNGVILGALSGGVLGFVVGARKDDCDHTPKTGPKYWMPVDCYAGEKIVHGLKIAALPALAGAGLGAVIDKLNVGQRLVYRAALSPSRFSVTTSVKW